MLDSVISGVSDVIINIVGIGGDNSADVGDDTPGRKFVNVRPVRQCLLRLAQQLMLRLAQ